METFKKLYAEYLSYHGRILEDHESKKRYSLLVEMATIIANRDPYIDIEELANNNPTCRGIILDLNSNIWYEKEHDCAFYDEVLIAQY